MSFAPLLANHHPTSFSQGSVEGLGAPLTNLSPHFAASDTSSFIFLSVLQDQKQMLFVTEGVLYYLKPCLQVEDRNCTSAGQQTVFFAIDNRIIESGFLIGCGLYTRTTL